MTSLFDLPFEEEEPEPLRPDDGRPRPAARAASTADPEVLTVSQLTADVRRLVESSFLRIAVEGELSNCRPWNGQLYFTLKDTGAQLRVVMFRTAARLLRFKPEDGQHVVARGRLTVYDPKGEYQLVCDRLEPRGLGALQLAFEQLKKRLEAEGLFSAARKRPLPALPRTIGIVTSPDGAALHDILTVLARRHPGARIVIRPTRVQGDGAAHEIARAMRAIGRVRGLDVVIVGRGGGSIEDLWAFNDEGVARAIASCPVPVVAAVGHETDVTIADFAADVRAPTPSAGAALVASRYEEVCGAVGRTRERMDRAFEARLLRLRNRVQRTSTAPALAGWPGRLALRGRHVAEAMHTLQRAMRTSLDVSYRRLDGLRARLEARDVRRRAALARNRMVVSDGRLHSAIARERHRQMTRFGTLATRLESLSPLAVLGRGYAVCWDAGRETIVRDAASIRPGEAIRVVLARGELQADVTRTTAPEDDEVRPSEREP